LYSSQGVIEERCQGLQQFLESLVRSHVVHAIASSGGLCHAFLSTAEALAEYNVSADAAVKQPTALAAAVRNASLVREAKGTQHLLRATLAGGVGSTQSESSERFVPSDAGRSERTYSV
jgi:hypothetical protein